MLQGRSMTAVVGGALCLLIFICSNRLFGPIAGLISELLAVFDPNLLGHSALVTADVTAAFFFTAAAWSYFRLLRFVNTRSFVITALSWSGLFLTKMSAPAILLVAVILATVQILSSDPMTIRVARVEQQIAGFWRKLILVSGLTTCIAGSCPPDNLGVVCVSLFSVLARRSSAQSLGRAMAGLPERSHHYRKHGCLHA